MAGRAVAALIGAVLAAMLAGCSPSSEISRELGARCDTADECVDRCLPPGAQFPGGMCSVACERAPDCPGATTCSDVEGGACLFTCDVDSECELRLGAGWACRAVPVHEEPTRQAKVCVGA